jgi:hypothetical protein
VLTSDFREFSCYPTHSNVIIKQRFYISVQDLLAHTLTTKNEVARMVGEFWQQFASLTGSY